MCNDFLILLNFTPNSNVTNYPANRGLLRDYSTLFLLLPYQ